MSNTVGGATIELGVDSTRVDSGLDNVDARVDRTGRNLQNLGSQGRRSLDGIAEGATRAATGMDAATRNITQQLQRAVAGFGAGKKAASEFFEDLAGRRGANLATLTPLLTQLRELEAAQARAAASAAATSAAQQAAAQAAAEAARVQAAAAREVAQAQAKQDSFIAALREQVALYGKSADEVTRYRAAQAGAAGAAEPLIQELGRLRAAEEGVATAARSAAQAQQQAAQVQAKADSFVAGLREQAALYGKSADEVLRYRAAQAGAAGAAEPLIQELTRLKVAEDAVAASARASALAQQQAAQAQSGRDNFIAGLQQQAAAIGKTRVELLELQAAQMGVAAQAAPMIAQLRAQEQGLNRTGMSAAATAAALRGVPAQFTDIVTSIQGGQPVLTVLLQQGGQLKDMFGGAGNAAKALGGYALGLVSPLTIVAAAVAVLTVAYSQGASESIAYGKAIATSGNAAGTTANQLSNMSRAVSQTLGTQGAAAESLVAIVGTGKVAAENLEKFSLVAIQAQRALGKSVEETAGEFAELGKAPAATLLKLNEQYHFLTAEVYNQVKALELQGRTIEAANIAQTAYASGAASVSSKVAANLGTLSKAWVGIKDVAKSAWDAMLNVGREETLEEKLAKVQSAIAKARKPFNPSIGGNAEARAQLAENIKLEASLKNQIKLEGEKAAKDRESNKLREAGVVWAAENEKYLTREMQLKNELKRATEQGADAKIAPEKIEERLAAIRKKYADVYNLTIDQQIEKVKSRGEIEEERAKRTAMNVASARSAGLATSLSAEIDYATKVEELDQAALAREKSRLQQELSLTAGKPNSLKEQAALRSQIALIDEKALTRQVQLKNEIFELEVKDTRQSAANLADLAQKRGEDADALESQLVAQRDANALIGLSKDRVADFNRALVEEAATRKEVEAGILDTIVGREAEADALRRSAVAMRSLGDAQRESILKTAQLDQQKKVWESIEQTAHDTFISIFDSGKSAFDRLRDTLKNGLLDLLYQMTIKKWIFNVGAQVSGNSSIGDLAGAFSGSSGGAGGGGSLLSTGASLLSMGKTIYSGFAGGIASSLGGLVAGFGNAIGSSAVASFGAGMSLTTAEAASAAAAASGTSAGVAAGGSLTAGAGAAAAIPIVGWIIAGMAASNGLYKQGWDANNGSVSQLGLAAGGRVALQSDSILQKLGMSAVGANILSGQATIAKLFGRKNPEVESGGIQGTFSAGGFSGENYANILEKGGWFRSDKRYTKTAALGADQDTGLDDTIKAMVASVKGFGSVLGAESSVIDSYSKQIKLELGSDEAKNKEAISKLFADIGDELSTKLLPNISKFSAEGETASATLQRLAGDYKMVDSVLVTIGRTSMQAFGTVGVASLEARERLIAAAGGLDKLASGTAFFAQNFLSPEEQMKPIIESIGEQLKALGLAGVDTTAEFKAAVLDLSSSGKLATEAGAAQYAALLALAPQFKQMTDYTQSLTDAMKESAESIAQRADIEKKIYDLTHSEAEILADNRQRELSGLSEVNRAAQLRYYALLDEKTALESVAAAMSAAAELLLTDVDAALAGMQRSVNAQKTQLATANTIAMESFQKSIETVSTAMADHVRLSDALRTSLKGIGAPGKEQATRAEAQAQLATALAIAKAGGKLPTADSLSGALGIVGQNAPKQFSSYLDYQRDAYRTANTIAGLADLTDSQVSIEEKTLAAIEKQKDSAEAAYEKEVARLDGLLDTAQQQVDAIKGVNTSVLSIPEALKALAQTIAAAMANPVAAAPSAITAAYQQYLGRDPEAGAIDFYTGAAGKGADVISDIKNSNEAKISSLYKSLLGRKADAAGIDYWVKAANAGMPISQIQDLIKSSDEYKKLHPFAVGTNFVPATMPALVHEGERIIPAADNRRLMALLNSPAEGGAALAAEVRRLQAVVESLEAVIAGTKGPAERAAKATESINKTLTRATRGQDNFIIKDYKEAIA